MAIILEVKNITKKYQSVGKSIKACDNISFKISAGELVSLLGLNGAGKTTLINIISTAIIPTSGSARVCGFDLSESIAIKKNIAVLHEKNPLYEKMTVKGFLLFCQNIYGIRDDRLILDLCDMWSLTTVLNNPIKNLSKGFKQRVGLVANLVHRPALLILDEPSSGLDAIQQDEFEKNILSLLGKTTVLLCTHNLGQASRICTRHLMLNEGKIFVSGSISDLKEKLLLEHKIKADENFSDEEILKKAFEVFLR